MIWIVMGVMILAILLYVLHPLYTSSQTKPKLDVEIRDYQLQIMEIDSQIANNPNDIDMLRAVKIGMQRQLLAKKTHNTNNQNSPFVLLSSLMIGFCFAALGLYTMLGRPELAKQTALDKPVLSFQQSMAQNATPQHDNNKSMPDLISQLEQKLQKDQNNPDSWILYARSLMNIGRFDDALIAYQNVLILSNNNPNVFEELENAKQFIMQRSGKPAGPPTASQTLDTSQSGPKRSDIEAASNMSVDERQAMIFGMVERLSQKLADAPDDPNGWSRLLRARKVIGDTEKSQQDIERMQSHFKNKPDIIEAILRESGWK